MNEADMKQAIEHDEANKAAQSGTTKEPTTKVLSWKDAVAFSDKQIAILAKQLAVNMLNLSANICSSASKNADAGEFDKINKAAANAIEFAQLAAQFDIIGDKAYVRASGYDGGGK